jgi:ribosome-associated protein
VAKGDLEIRVGLVIPAGELILTGSRSSGPGGQHVNKSSTRVSLRWNISESRALDERSRSRLQARLGSRLTRRGELIVHADRERSRQRNLDAVRRRMAALVEEALRQRASRRTTRPTRGSEERRLDAKRRQATTKKGRAAVRRHGAHDD